MNIKKICKSFDYAIKNHLKFIQASLTLLLLHFFFLSHSLSRMILSKSISCKKKYKKHYQNWITRCICEKKRRNSKDNEDDERYFHSFIRHTLGTLQREGRRKKHDVEEIYPKEYHPFLPSICFSTIISTHKSICMNELE